MAHASDRLLLYLSWIQGVLSSLARGMLGKASSNRRCESQSEVARSVGNAKVNGFDDGLRY